MYARLLSFLENAIGSEPLCCWSNPFPTPDQSQYAHEAMRLLRDGFKVRFVVNLDKSSFAHVQGLVSNDVLFRHVLDWKRHLCSAELPHGERKVWSIELGQWLSDVRLSDELALALAPSLCKVQEQRLSELLSQLKLGGIRPQDVVLVCEVGSKLYNLSLPTSDSDYIVIFRHPTSAILSSVQSLKVTHLGRPG